MKPDRTEESPRQHAVRPPNPVHDVLRSETLLAQIAHGMPDAWCRKMRSVSFNWYRVLSNVITRRCLAKLPVYQQDEWLSAHANRQLESQSHSHQRTRLQALTHVFSQRSHRHGHVAAEASSARVSRVQEFKQLQLAALLKVAHAQREAGWKKLELLKCRLWEACSAMKLNGQVSASWYHSTRDDLMVPPRFEVPWYFGRPNPDSPSLLMLCLQMYAVCKTLYPTQDAADREKYGALEAHGVYPLPSRLTMRYIEQLIDHALSAPNPHGPWALEAASDQARLRESVRPPTQGKEPEWALVAHMAQVDMTEELATYQHITGIHIRTSLSATRLKEMMRVPTHVLPCCELLRVCDVRVADQAVLAKIFDHALGRHDWRIMAHILRDCDPILHAYTPYADLSRREQLIRALVTSPAPEGKKQQSAMMQVFETLRRDSINTQVGQRKYTLHARCLKFFTPEITPNQPVQAKLRAWEAVANHVTDVVERHWGTPGFREKASNVLKAIFKIQVQLAEPVLMTLIAATDNVLLYRRAINIGLLTPSQTYTNAPHAGRSCGLASFNRNLSPLHAVLQHDALNLFIEMVDPAYIFEGKTLMLDGKERPLSDSVARLHAHAIRRFLEAGGIPNAFSSSQRADAFAKSVIAAQSKFAEPLPVNAPALKDMPAAKRSAHQATEVRITQLMQTHSTDAAKLAATLCKRLETPRQELDAIALLRRLWGHASCPQLTISQQEILCNAVRQTALRMETDLEQHDLTAFTASGVHQHRLSVVLSALAMPYDGLTRLDAARLIRDALPLCLGQSTHATRDNYRALNKAVAHAGLRYAASNLDPYACTLLLGTGHAMSESHSRPDEQNDFTALASDLMPLFYASYETAEAHVEQIHAHVQKWQALSPSARFKGTGSAGKLRDDINTFLRQIVQLRLPVRDIQTVFRGLCIVNESALTTDVLRAVHLSLGTLDETARNHRWHCFEIMLEHGAHKVFHGLTKKGGGPGHWLALSAKRIEHALKQSNERGAAVLNRALSDVSRPQLIDFFKNVIRESPDRFSSIDSELYQILRYHAQHHTGLTQADIKQLAQLGKDLHGHDAYRTILRAASE